MMWGVIGFPSFDQNSKLTSCRRNQPSFLITTFSVPWEATRDTKKFNQIMRVPSTAAERHFPSLGLLFSAVGRFFSSSLCICTDTLIRRGRGASIAFLHVKCGLEGDEKNNGLLAIATFSPKWADGWPAVITFFCCPCPMMMMIKHQKSTTFSATKMHFNSSPAPVPTVPTTPMDLPSIQRSTAELVEILIYSLCLLVGGPLNLFSFRKLVNALFRPPSTSARPFGAQMALLKLHLNIADLITMFIYTLSQIIWMISYQWYAGDLLCRVCKFFHTFGFYLNSFVVACFAIDRFLGTRNLNNPSATTVAHVRAKRMLSVAWVWAIMLSIPQCFIFRVFEPSEMPNFKQCTPIWTILGYELDIKLGALAGSGHEVERKELVDQFEEVLKWERAYNLAHLLFVFWIPSLIIVASYASILVTLNSLSVVPHSIRRGTSFRSRRSKKDEKCDTALVRDSTMNESMELALKNGSVATQQTLTEEEALRERCNGGAKVGSIAAQTIAKARQNAKRQAALILAAYLTFWSPYNLLAMINAFAPKDGTVREIFSITLPFLNSLIVVNPIVNPLIYGVFECGRKY